jgi:hypothetical protein
LFLHKRHIVQALLSQFILAGCLFFVFFGQGVHLHELTVHLDAHFDLHLHMHAHESADSPLEDESQESDSHQHEVNSSADIVATLNTPVPFNPELETDGSFLPVSAEIVASLSSEDTPTLFDLPPPRAASDPYHLSSYSHRGPPLV